ncbi:MAG: nitrogenase component 1, partial [Candidatus Gracilibacteria bacterium]|nr:nitrogenase component 1 [Candidatus Gracilibacteria bacterium]
KNNISSIDIYFGCMPIMIGDNSKVIIDENKKDFDMPLIYVDQTPDYSFKKLENILQNLDSKNGKKDKNLCTILGYPLSKSLLELENLLKKLEIKLNYTFPLVEIDKLKKISESNLTIFVDAGRNEKINELFDNLPLDIKKEKLPYGINNSINFLRNLVANFNLDAKKTKLLEKYIEKSKKEFVKRKQELAKINLGFVLISNHLNEFLGNFRGVELIDFIKEVGFGGVHIFYYLDKNSEHKKEIEQKIKKDFGGYKNLNITFGDTKKDLDAFLDKKEVALYYSEIFNDKRVLDKGKMQFSLDCFEPSLDGFLRTIDNLIKLSKISEKLRNYN